MGTSAVETRPAESALEAQRQRDELVLLRDHLERLLATLLRAMPRADVESLLAGCGSIELIQFGTDAVAATVATTLLENPDRWAGAREAIRRGSQRGHARSCDPPAREEAEALTDQLLARLDFGLGIYRRRRASLETALEQARAARPRRSRGPSDGPQGAALPLPMPREEPHER